ncbi:MAG: transporter, partial [Alphaproteobacteria bacterium]|nr:transporter [Alphaproteobacteria bacterium]
AAPTRASGIVASIIGPHEYDLPVDFQPFNVVVQYVQWNDDSRYLDSHGDKVAGPGTQTLVGVTKYARFFTWDALPKVGMAMVAFLPEIRMWGSGIGVAGLGDPVIGPSAWVKPTPNTTIGLATAVSIPIGDVSNEHWANLTGLFFDARFGDFGLTGEAGGVFRGDQSAGLPARTERGTSWHLNLRLSHRLTPAIEPYLAADAQATETDRRAGIGLGNDSGEVTMGAGLMWTLTPAAHVSLRWDQTVAGHDAIRTDGATARLAVSW